MTQSTGDDTIADLIEGALETPAQLSMKNEPGKRESSKMRKAVKQRTNSIRSTDKPSQARALFRAYAHKEQE